jgi:hypothetical protein
MADKRTGGPPRPPVTSPTTTTAKQAEAVSTVPRGADKVRALLRLSGERDLWLGRLLAAERSAYKRGISQGYDRGFGDGWRSCEEASEREHRAVAAMVRETPQQRAASAERRVRSAEAYTRRHAAWWEREFYRRHPEMEAVA